MSTWHSNGTVTHWSNSPALQESMSRPKERMFPFRSTAGIVSHSFLSPQYVRIRGWD